MYIERALQTETTQVYELQLPIEGEIRTHEARIVVCGEDEVVAIVRDVSERAKLDADRQRAELALQESRDLFSATFNESTDAIFIVDGQTGLILDCNQRSLEIFEADHKEELLGKQGTSFHKTPWTPEIMAAVNQELQANGVWNSEIEYCTCKDNVFWGSISNKLFSMADKSLIWVRITDISDRKQAETSLRESEGRLKLALDATQMGIWDLNLLTKQSTWSESCEVLYGLAPGGFEGTQAAFLRQVHPDDLECVQQYLIQVTQQDMELSHEFRIVHPDGSIRWILERGQIFYDEDGNAVRILGISIDITDRKQFEAFLQQANEELDIKVAERTAELNHAIAQLQQEILQRQQTEAALQDAHAKLTQWVDDLEQRHQEITLLNEMSDLMQACLTVDEAYIVIAQLMPHLFPGCGGAVYAISESKQLVEAATIWGEQADADGEAAIASQFLFTSDQCLALRRGQPHYVEDTHRGLCCPHLLSPLPQSYFCVPMVAQGTASGVLYISSPEQPLTQAKQQLATTVARQVALAIANLKLYATLQNQSTRDPLTGLFNRRYLGEFLERELRRAERNQRPLSVLLLDVDHFKQFNDTYGHDAGDAVLCHLSQFLQAQVRGSDIACRYGGEEMVLILPEVALNIAHQRAEQIRQGVKHLAIEHQQQLGSITVSVGIACFPDHGSTSDLLLQSADLALYQAKAAGRDLVVAVS